jgi:nicotinate-nucleotide adenylyltransferase
VHNGHLHVARSVCDRLGLDAVHLVLSARPPHRDAVAWADRWAMLGLACANDSRLVADDREAHRNARSYTVDTLTLARRQAPSEQLFWIVGMDSLLALTSWYRWWRILQLAHLVVVRRPGYPLRLGAQLRHQVQRRLWRSTGRVTRRGAALRPPTPAGRILFLEEEMLQVSATSIRATINNGSVAADLPETVSDYIQSCGLYAADN